MKKILAVFTVLSCVACVSAPVISPPSKSTPMLVKETSLFADGFVDTVRTYTYDEKTGYLLKEELFSQDNEKLETVDYFREKGVIVRKESHDADGKKILTHVYSDYPNGLLKSDRVLNESNKEQNSSVYEYDKDGNKTDWNVYDGFGSLLASSRYTYAGGLKSRVQTVDAKGLVIQAVDIQYSGKQKLRENYLVDNSVLEKYVVFEYSGTNLIRESTFDAKNNPTLKIDYSYDAAGNLVKLTYADREGSTTEIIERVYAVQALKEVTK